MRTHFRFFYIVFGMILLTIIGLFVFKIDMIAEARKNGKTVYEINVNSFNRIETYTTTEFTRGEKTGCIKFKDEFGLKHVVCNNYTITEY
jgi:hypothetical protein